jgi:hypothetical protein
MSKDKAADYFARHKESNECHITADGRVFHSIGSASGFANTLKDNKVESFKRDSKAVENIEVVDETEETGTDEETEGKNLPSTDELVSSMLNKMNLNEFNPETTSYEDAKKLAQDLKLETVSNKKVDIFAALEVAKANLAPQA